MNDLRRRNHFDVTDRIFVGEPGPVRDAVTALLRMNRETAPIDPTSRPPARRHAA